MRYINSRFTYLLTMSPICPHCGNGKETAELLLLFCPKYRAERQRYFGDSIDITDP